MRFVPLGSGSSGNAALLELGSTRLLIDAGLSARALAERVATQGVEPCSIDWILLSHEHTDHVRGAELFSRRHGAAVVSFPETLEAMDCSPAHFTRWIPFSENGPQDLGGVEVETFSLPHDAARPVGFLLRGEGLKIGIATDLGHATTLVRQRLRGCQVLMLESNHDDTMLREGPYPWNIKQRVAGRMGHLSNDDAADLLRDVVDQSCRAVVLAHLSEKNNRPELARRAAAAALGAVGRSRIVMRVATARTPTPAVELHPEEIKR
jgi:phosphoribosyl 1,2-cyclic phosphodiesterase